MYNFAFKPSNSCIDLLLKCFPPSCPTVGKKTFPLITHQVSNNAENWSLCNMYTACTVESFWFIWNILFVDDQYLLVLDDLLLQYITCLFHCKIYPIKNFDTCSSGYKVTQEIRKLVFPTHNEDFDCPSMYSGSLKIIWMFNIIDQ